MRTARITAAICTYQRGELLREALASLAGQSLEPECYHVVVVDNAPQQLVGKYDVSESFPRVRWLHASPVGLSNARNTVLSACVTPFIAFLDDDALATVDWLAKLLLAFDELGEQVVAIGGRVEPVWVAPRPPWLPDELLGLLSLVDWGGARRLLPPSQWIAGTNMAFRVAALSQIGGFSNKFGRFGGDEVLLSNEENDVISRLREQGGEIAYVPEAVVSHLVPQGRLTQSWIRRRVVWQAISDYLQHPKESFAKARGHWAAVERFSSALPPEYQALHSLCIEQSDPEIFRRQTAALYSYTIALLSGFHGING